MPHVTHGTNNAGMDLYAVLAEVDGSGIPLAYLFLDTVRSDNGTRYAQSSIAIISLRSLSQPKKAGAISFILDRFLETIKTAVLTRLSLAATRTAMK